MEVVLDDERDPLWSDYSIEVVPTVILFDCGNIVCRLDAKPGVGLDVRELAAALASR